MVSGGFTTYIRLMRWIIGALLAGIGLTAAQADTPAMPTDLPAPPADRWHHVTPASPFFSEESPAQRVAAVLQSDGKFARVILGADDLGAYVTVALPGTEPAASLRSELMFANGAKVSRTVYDTTLDTLAMPGADMMIYSFAIAPEDLSAFRQASEWILTPDGAEPVTITLDGSAAALSAALTDALDSPGLPATAQDDTPASEKPLLTRLPASSATD